MRAGVDAGVSQVWTRAVGSWGKIQPLAARPLFTSASGRQPLCITLCHHEVGCMYALLQTPEAPLSFEASKWQSTIPSISRHCICSTQVVIGVGDPNPLVASEGIATLEKAGIEVGGWVKEEADFEVGEGEGWPLYSPQADGMHSVLPTGDRHTAGRH